MALLLAAVDTSALVKVVVASFIAGITVTATFSVAIAGATLSAEMQRDDRTIAAVAYGILTVVALLAFVAAVVVGLVVMTSK